MIQLQVTKQPPGWVRVHSLDFEALESAGVGMCFLEGPGPYGWMKVYFAPPWIAPLVELAYDGTPLSFVSDPSPKVRLAALLAQHAPPVQR